jgi:DNA-binding response OmpR family regulator
MKYDGPLTGKCVLLVEDDVSLANDLENLLGTLGYNDIYFASDLMEAQKIAATEKLDVALLDVNLGGGIKTVELGRSLARKGVRILFMSAFNAEDMAMATRGFEFVEKPLSLPRLKAALQRAFVRRPLIPRKPDFGDSMQINPQQPQPPRTKKASPMGSPKLSANREDVGDLNS